MPPAVKGRQRRAAAPEIFEDENEDSDVNVDDDAFENEEVNDGDEAGDEEEEEDSSAMFLKMFDAIRKNAVKSNKGGRVSARQRELDVKSDKYRHEVEVFVKDGNAYIDELVASANLLRSENNGRTRMRTKEMQNSGAQVWIDMMSAVNGSLELSPSLADDIAHKRVSEIDDACRRIALQPEKRAKSLRGLKRALREEVGEVVEYEQVASDAEELIRSYKAMLRT